MQCRLCEKIEPESDQATPSEYYYCADCIAKHTMICPTCKNVAKFKREERDGPYFGYYCSHCKGMWFDLDILEFRPDGSMFFFRYRNN